MAISKLSADEIQSRLGGLPDWSLEGEHLHRRFVFQNFVAAFGFMSQVALLAERADHHPEWSNTYKTVDIRLSTHEAGGISLRDFELAAAINAILTRQQPS